MLGPNWEEEAMESGWLEPIMVRKTGAVLQDLMENAEAVLKLYPEKEVPGWPFEGLKKAIQEARMVIDHVLPE